MSTTLKQTTANRLNSLKSTGAQSPEGKAASRMNALKSGIYAESTIINGEDPAALDCLTGQYYERFLPKGPEECVLLDIVVSSEWTLRRLRTTEAQMWNRTMERKRKWFGERKMSMDLEYLQEAAYADPDREKHFDRLHRRMAAVERSLRGALDSLSRLRKQGFGAVGEVSQPPEQAPEGNEISKPISVQPIESEVVKNPEAIITLVPPTPVSSPVSTLVSLVEQALPPAKRGDANPTKKTNLERLLDR